MEAAAALATAFAVTFVAELGDKSQLAVLAQASRHRRPARVLAEAAAAFAILSALAVTAGAWLAGRVDGRAVALAAAGLFLAFAALAVRRARKPAGQEAAAPALRRGGTFLLVLVSELGDKTQLATAALAAHTGRPLATAVGAWGGEVLAAALALAAGAWLARVLSPRRAAVAAAVLFTAGAIVTLALEFA